MADLNTTYHAYTHKYDIDELKQELWYDILPDNVRANVDLKLAELTKFNNSQDALVELVKVPYTGTTSKARLDWLSARINAVYDRMDMVRADAEGNKQQLLNLGVQPSPDAYSTVAKLLTAIPPTRPVGALAEVISKIVSNDSGNEVYKQTKIRESNEILSGYTLDVQQLTAIQTQLLSEYKGSSSSNVASDEVKFSAPSTWPVSYYVILIVAVFLFLLIVRRRQQYN